MSEAATAANTKIGTTSTDEEKIEAWRRKELEEAGYNELHAAHIASRHTGPDAIDLHYAVDLVKEKGCDPHVAAEILS